MASQETFKEHSVAEFFKKNKQMLGFSGKIRSLTTIVHEYVTNSFDACEEAGILPEIEMEMKETGKDRYLLKVKDNGPGIPKKHLGKALGMMLAGTKFHRYIQQRGQQGIGAAGCTMYSLLTTGKPVYAESGNGKEIIKCNISVDFKTNKPVLTNIIEEPSDFRGLVVEAEFGDVKFEKSNYGVIEYLRRSALVNPHAKIRFTDPSGEAIVFPRSTEEIPPKPVEVQPHPLGITAHDLLDLSKAESEYSRLSSFLQARFSRVSLAKVNELKDMLPEINFNKNPKNLSWEECEMLVQKFKDIKWISPSADGIIPIGKDLIEKSFVNVLNPEIVVVSERKPKIYKGGIPFVVEAGIAYGGGIASAGKKGEVMRFANRAPLLFDAGGCAITETVKSVDWKRYNLKNFDEEPIVVLVNISSVHIPYVTAGKQAIAGIEEVSDEIKNAVMEASRKVQVYISGKRKKKEAETKRKVIRRYVNQLSSDLAELAETDDEEKLKEKLSEMVENRYT
ncbi:DNA topoisomerase VI subunit B [Candidatus Micrarchaeota archaeon]|nr:DNA topoisomerase VI subunit B [Candidatus Micrarchaeota archaeon]